MNITFATVDVPKGTTFAKFTIEADDGSKHSRCVNLEDSKEMRAYNFAKVLSEIAGRELTDKDIAMLDKWPEVRRSLFR
jgi:hypothetical protein